MLVFTLVWLQMIEPVLYTYSLDESELEKARDILVRATFGKVTSLRDTLDNLVNRLKRDGWTIGMSDSDNYKESLPTMIFFFATNALTVDRKNLESSLGLSHLPYRKSNEITKWYGMY